MLELEFGLPEVVVSLKCLGNEFEDFVAMVVMMFTAYICLDWRLCRNIACSFGLIDRRNLANRHGEWMLPRFKLLLERKMLPPNSDKENLMSSLPRQQRSTHFRSKQFLRFRTLRLEKALPVTHAEYEEAAEDFQPPSAMPKLLGQDRHCEVRGEGTCGAGALKKFHCESIGPTWLEVVVIFGMPEKAEFEFL